MKTASYMHTSTDDALPSLSLPPFVGIIVADEVVSEERQNAVASWLVHSGCLYLVAWGRDCESWHDSVDRVNIADFSGTDIPDDRFVLTVWYAHKPLSEAFWFAAGAEHLAVALDHVLIVHVAPRENGEALLSAYDSASDEWNAEG